MGARCFLISPCWFSHTPHFRAYFTAPCWCLLPACPLLALPITACAAPPNTAIFSSPPPVWSWVSPGRILPLAKGKEKHHHGYGWKSLCSCSQATNLKSEIMDIPKIVLIMLPAPGDPTCPQWTCFTEADREWYNLYLLVSVKPFALVGKEFLLRNSY